MQVEPDIWRWEGWKKHERACAGMNPYLDARALGHALSDKLFNGGNALLHPLTCLDMDVKPTMSMKRIDTSS